MVSEPARTRKKEFKLDRFRLNKDTGKNLYLLAEYVVDEWNRLGSHVVSANTVVTFGKRLDKFIDSDVMLGSQELPCISLSADSLCSYASVCLCVSVFISVSISIC